MKLFNTLAASAALSAVMAGAAFAQNTTNPTQAFNVTGAVASACVLGAFNGSASLGTITVDLTPGDSNLFKIVTPINTVGPTAAGGCNDGVTVGLTKGAQGLTTTPDGTGYDATVFQANIPYAVTIFWSGPSRSGKTTTAQQLTTGVNQQINTATGGAFISNINSVISVPATSKAVLAGTYTDTVGVQLAVY
jgi:hypothetical protein